MTDREINEAVARKLGTLRKDDHGNDCLDCIPDYCHSIEAGWEVAAHVTEFSVIRLANGQWRSMTDTSIQDADTAPMAICLAFLKLEVK